jgi:hypothetical protein
VLRLQWGSAIQFTTTSLAGAFDCKSGILPRAPVVDGVSEVTRLTSVLLSSRAWSHILALLLVLPGGRG